MKVTTNINTPDYWNRVYQREWESQAVGTSEYHRDYGPIHDAIIELIPDGARVLDIACGPGLLCRKIKSSLPNTSVTGVDFSAYAIARNTERDESLGIEYICMDVRTLLDSLPRHFDAVTMCETALSRASFATKDGLFAQMRRCELFNLGLLTFE